MIHNRPVGQNLFFNERKEQGLRQSANAYADFHEPHNIVRSSNDTGPQAIQRAAARVNLLHEQMLNMEEQIRRVHEHLELVTDRQEIQIAEFKDYLDAKLFEKEEQEEEEEEEEQQQSICCRIL